MEENSPHASAPKEQGLEQERERALSVIERAFEWPMIILAFIWLFLTLVDLIKGLSPMGNNMMTFIWVIFWIDFLIKFSLASKKKNFLSRNWLTLIALAVPALRIFRIFRALRFAQVLRGTRLIRILGTFNRGMKALNASLGRKGFGFVMGLSLIVILLGGAGIYALEGGKGYYDNFATAVWWSAMMITTMGTDTLPVSSEGRLLSLLLALYGFSVFGYVTASVASFFIDRDADAEDSEVAKASEVSALRNDISSLSSQISALERRLTKKHDDPN